MVMMNAEVYGEYVEHRVINESVNKSNDKRKTRHLTKRASEILFIIAMLFFPLLQFIIFWVIPNFDSIIM